MRGKNLRLKFKPGEDVTIAEGSGEAMGGFELDSGSTSSASGTELHDSLEDSRNSAHHFQLEVLSTSNCQE
jgi:hypothetical protein